MINAVVALLSVVLFMQPGPAAPPKFSAKLLAAHESVAPGGETELLVEITVDKPWHIYNPIILDTGLATDVQFAAPEGGEIGVLRFPPPELAETAEQEYLEHTGTIRAIAGLKAPPDAAPGQTAKISAKITGLACIELCMLVEADASIELPVTAEQGQPANVDLFKDARESLTPPLADAPYIKGSELSVSKDKLAIGEAAALTATIRVQAGHHVQDRDPGVKNLIASRLFIQKIDGIEFAEESKQIWPKPREHEVEGVGKVREQSGEFEIRVPFSIVDEKFPSGPVTVRVLFRYQCCTDAGQCFAPEMAEGFVQFVAETPNPPRKVEFTELIAPGSAGEAPDGQAPSAEKSGNSEAAAATHDFSNDPTPELTAADWAETIPWRHWRPGWAEELSRRGKLVYVDYTATWCLTCQTNKKAVLDTKKMRSLMAELGVIPIEADFTNKSPTMLAEIKKWNRPTVPLNIIYAPGKPDKVVVLPVLLVGNEELVMSALKDPEKYADKGEKSESLLWMLVAGFLGGLILNVMPCVLPVISIKIISFVQQAGEDPKRVFKLGLAFCAGIMVWFWAFAVMTSYGELPWQYPEVVVVLSAILFVFALNLFGVFEMILPGAAAGGLGALASREGYTGAFLKGLLATLLGTACTAPFLAGAMAYALTQPSPKVFAVFTAAGLGMSAPYLVLTAKPAWLKFLPKPGAWMVTFKQAAGFILLGTVVWLLWILAHQIDGVGVVWTVAFLGFLGMAAWMLGKISPLWETGGRVSMWCASILVALLGFYFCYFVMYDWIGARDEIRDAGAVSTQTDGQIAVVGTRN